MFCDYLIIIGEKDGGKMFNFLKQRRDEFLEETKDIILRQLITDHTTDKVLREHYVDKQTLNTQEKIKTSLSFLN